MRAPAFQTWFSQFIQLNHPQREQLRAALAPGAGLAQLAALLEQVCREGRACPRCASRNWMRHGHARGLQGYRCRECGRTFNDLSNTPLSRLRRRDAWAAYFSSLLEARSVRAAATEAAIHRNTAFRWRHRFIGQIRRQRTEVLTGIVEADEMFLLESQKGSRTLDRPARGRGGKATRPGISRELDCIVVARDRTGHTWDAVTGRGAVTSRQLHQHLAPRLDAHALLATDGHKAYQRFTQEAGIAHQIVNLRQGQRVRASMRGAIHVQNVNAYHSRFRLWLSRFLGVASRYLPNYLDWRWSADGHRASTIGQLLHLIIGPIKPNNAFG